MTCWVLDPGHPPAGAKPGGAVCTWELEGAGRVDPFRWLQLRTARRLLRKSRENPLYVCWDALQVLLETSAGATRWASCRPQYGHSDTDTICPQAVEFLFSLPAPAHPARLVSSLWIVKGAPGNILFIVTMAAPCPQHHSLFMRSSVGGHLGGVHCFGHSQIKFLWPFLSKSSYGHMLSFLWVKT